MTEPQSNKPATMERTQVRGPDQPSRGAGKAGTAVPAAAAAARGSGRSAARFVEVPLFDEDIPAVIALLPAHRFERLPGWTEYRTGGVDFRATVSWGEAFGRAPQSDEERCLLVPRLVEVLASILVGSAKGLANLTPAQEFNIYRGVIRDLYFRVDEMQSRFE